MSKEAERLLDLKDKLRNSKNLRLYLRYWYLRKKTKDLEYELDRAKRFKPDPKLIIDKSLADQMIMILNYVRGHIVKIVFDIFVRSANIAYDKKMYFFIPIFIKIL